MLQGSTYMEPAIKNANHVLDSGRKGVPKVMLMMTDGVPHDRIPTGQQFNSAKAAGTKVMMLLIGTGINVGSARNRAITIL